MLSPRRIAKSHPLAAHFCAIAFATERPTWHVTGSDISAEALIVARKNALRLGAVWNVGFKPSDVLEHTSQKQIETPATPESEPVDEHPAQPASAPDEPEKDSAKTEGD